MSDTSLAYSRALTVLKNRYPAEFEAHRMRVQVALRVSQHIDVPLSSCSSEAARMLRDRRRQEFDQIRASLLKELRDEVAQSDIDSALESIMTAHQPLPVPTCTSLAEARPAPPVKPKPRLRDHLDAYLVKRNFEYDEILAQVDPEIANPDPDARPELEEELVASVMALVVAGAAMGVEVEDLLNKYCPA